MARDANKNYRMQLLVDTRLSGQNYEAGDDVELSGLEADRLEANRIVKPKPRKKAEDGKPQTQS